MGFSHKVRKLRDRVRKQYTDETGRSDWKAPEFRRWLIERGELEAPSVPQAEPPRGSLRYVIKTPRQ